MLSMLLKTVLFISLLMSMIACSTSHKKQTLADIDIVGKASEKTAKKSIKISNEAIRGAYADYLNQASKDEKSRLTAINRLAELEFELGNRLIQENNSLKDNNIDDIDATYVARLEATIELISTSLREYPKASKNDKLLYNLANAYDQLGKSDQSNTVLTKIVNEYPDSEYYLESQFRVAEQFFSMEKYVAAEDSYTNVITLPKNERFIEKAFLKRGWSRLKLGYYHEAVEDFLETISYHGFSDTANLTVSERDVFNEYIRAIGLSFSYMESLDEIVHYFKNNPDLRYTYEIYTSISDNYLKQNRYSDSASTLTHFSKHYPNSPHVPESKIKVIEGWRMAGLSQKIYDDIEFFYTAYNPDNQYWKNQNIAEEKLIIETLKEYVLLMMEHYHKKYQASHSDFEFSNAEKWYTRYLNHYSTYSRKDNVHYLYAELLFEHNDLERALHHYELSAYDGHIILNKNAAYNTILTTSRLYSTAKSNPPKEFLLNKHINYASLFSQLYPNDDRVPSVISHAAELAFKANDYSKVIELTNLIVDRVNPAYLENSSVVRGHAYFELGQFSNAEAVYKSILSIPNPNYSVRKKIDDNLALSIYKQGEEEQQKGNGDSAIYHFTRIATVTPRSDVAAIGMNEAINIAIANDHWDTAINAIKNFQSLFPNHEFNQDLSKKLSMSYLKNGQEISAAKEYEKMAKNNNDVAVKMAAQWRAAEIYESNNEPLLAIKAYQLFSETYNRPYSQYLEAMQKIVNLYESIGDTTNTEFWRYAILNADKNTSNEEKTDRTKIIASSTALNLARYELIAYKEIDLTLPLKSSLDKKRTSLQKAIKFFGQASIYGIAETSTEANYSIGEIYRLFSQALLKSARPVDLNGEELEQYNLLLEDQAFPFEDKAIEFFQANLLHLRKGIYDSWVRLSHDQLKLLFPARYQRGAITDVYINVLH